MMNGVGGKVPEVVRYLNTHYMEEISLEKLARRFYLNPSYLSRNFHKVMGVSYSDYLLHVRMRQAVQLLNHTDKKVSEISLAVGFHSDNHFCKMFRQVMGISPCGTERSSGAGTPERSAAAFSVLPRCHAGVLLKLPYKVVLIFIAAALGGFFGQSSGCLSAKTVPAAAWYCINPVSVRSRKSLCIQHKISIRSNSPAVHLMNSPVVQIIGVNTHARLDKLFFLSGVESRAFRSKRTRQLGKPILTDGGGYLNIKRRLFDLFKLDFRYERRNFIRVRQDNRHARIPARIFASVRRRRGRRETSRAPERNRESGISGQACRPQITQPPACIGASFSFRRAMTGVIQWINIY